jgi:POT family proton-dependent oligopeptide transporter
MVGQLAPIRLRGLMMGIWMMITGIAAIFSDFFSKMALGTSGTINPLTTNASYSHTFSLLGWSSIAAAVLLLLLTPFVAKLTKERLNKNHPDEERDESDDSLARNVVS